MVYGTGYPYESWCSTTTYYGWGWTWGYGYLYSPWYNWWTWRPWWSGRNGLRAALIDNIYDRWQSGNHVTPHDRSPGAQNASGIPTLYGGYFGYPALYGRFQGSARPTPLIPPGNTLALNPYSRPSSSARAGNVPGGAQLLSTLRQSPGGGRDLYAAPDGNIYQRKGDSWYRRDAAGKFNFYASSQGAAQRSQNPPARPAPAANATRPNATGPGIPTVGNPARMSRMPDTDLQLRAQNVADLDRQYYTRNLARTRAQNARPAAPAPRPAPIRAAPVRGGGFRR